LENSSEQEIALFTKTISQKLLPSIFPLEKEISLPNVNFESLFTDNSDVYSRMGVWEGSDAQAQLMGLIGLSKGVKKKPARRMHSRTSSHYDTVADVDVKHSEIAQISRSQLVIDSTPQSVSPTMTPSTPKKAEAITPKKRTKISLDLPMSNRIPYSKVIVKKSSNFNEVEHEKEEGEGEESAEIVDVEEEDDDIDYEGDYRVNREESPLPQSRKNSTVVLPIRKESKDSFGEDDSFDSLKKPKEVKKIEQNEFEASFDNEKGFETSFDDEPVFGNKFESQNNSKGFEDNFETKKEFENNFDTNEGFETNFDNENGFEDKFEPQKGFNSNFETPKVNFESQEGFETSFDDEKGFETNFDNEKGFETNFDEKGFEVNFDEEPAFDNKFESNGGFEDKFQTSEGFEDNFKEEFETNFDNENQFKIKTKTKTVTFDESQTITTQKEEEFESNFNEFESNFNPTSNPSISIGFDSNFEDKMVESIMSKIPDLTFLKDEIKTDEF
jgi:hypothetical protein